MVTALEPLFLGTGNHPKPNPHLEKSIRFKNSEERYVLWGAYFASISLPLTSSLICSDSHTRSKGVMGFDILLLIFRRLFVFRWFVLVKARDC